MTSRQPVMLSGVQPTAQLTLGNYLGAIRNWVQLQHRYLCYFMVVDLHSLTAEKGRENLSQNCLQALATYIAAGINPNNACLFFQSRVPEHAELSWALTCFAYMGELGRMTQYKEKSAKAGANIPAGIFAYPVLMAADILLYDSNLVPVGADQKQHLELTRDLAMRCNNLYGADTFVVPEPFIPPQGARIMDLQTPTAKMSKSAENPMGTIFLADSAKEIEKKFKRAVTDSNTDIVYAEDRPGVKNLIDIQVALTGKATDEIVQSYVGKQYGHLKVETAAIVIEALAPLQSEVQRLLHDKGELLRIAREGATRAHDHAKETLQRFYQRVGLIVD